MPRRGYVEKRKVEPDPIYNSVLVAKFINRLMKKGKKSLAERIFYKSLSLVQERVGKNPLEVFKEAVENTRPHVAVKSRRVGGATYQVPVEVPRKKGVSLAIRWLILAARARRGRSMVEKLAAEILDAARKQGAAIKKREDTHRMAEANRAFAHYRW
jgi:small subunit ribosomal protein S7